MLPCLRLGCSTRFVCRVRSARISFGRVWCGSMTSSMYPRSAAERGYIDDVIEPHQTRPKLIRALRTLQTKRVEQPKRKHGNIPL